MSKKYFLYFVKLFDKYNCCITLKELDFLMLFVHSFCILNHFDFTVVYDILNLGYDAQYRADCLYNLYFHLV